MLFMEMCADQKVEAKLAAKHQVSEMDHVEMQVEIKQAEH